MAGCIIARTHMGARDLNCGLPQLKGARVVDVIPKKDEDFTTKIVLQKINGETFDIIIKQAY